MSTTATVAPDLTKPEERAWKFAFVVALVAFMVNYLIYNSYSPLLPAIQKALNMNFTQVGLFGGIIGPIGIIFSIPIGIYMKRYGVKVAVLTATALTTLGLAILALSGDFVTGLAGRFVWVFGFRIAVIACNAALAIVSPKRIVTMMLILGNVMQSAGSVFGAPAAAAIGTANGWQAGIWFLGALALVALIIFWLFFPQQSTAKASEARAATTAGVPAASPYKSPVAWGVSLLAGLQTFINSGVATYVPLVLVQNFKMTAIDVGNLVSVYRAGGIIMALALGYLSTRYDTRKWPMLFIFGFGTIGVLLLMPQDRTLTLVGCVMALSVFFTAGPAILYAVQAHAFPAREIGPAYAMIGFVGSLFSWAGPQLLGIARDMTGGFFVGWIIQLVAAVLGIILVWWLKTK